MKTLFPPVEDEMVVSRDERVRDLRRGANASGQNIE